MHPFDGITLGHLRERTSFKWRMYPEDVLPLWVAEMDVTPAQAVIDAVNDALTRGDTGYPIGTGYADAFSAMAAARWGWNDIDVANTLLMPDVMVGISELLRLLVEPGGSVVVTSPVYPPFYSFPEHIGLNIVEAPLDAHFRINADSLTQAFERATRDGAAVLLLSNPHNPTGTVHTRDELALVSELASTYGVRVIADEIHAPLTLPGATFTPYLTVDPRGLVVTSASKSWNLAGFKAAIAIAGPDAAADLARIPEVVSHGVSHMGVIAHTAALRGGVTWLDALISELAQRRALLGNLLHDHLPEVGYVPPEATYLAWLDCRPLNLPVSDSSSTEPVRGNVLSLDGPAAFFVEHAKVALSAGPAFGSGGAGHVRLNFGTSDEVLTEAIERMARAVAAQ